MMTRIEWQNIITEVKRAVPLRQGFQLLGWRAYHGKRADCGLCRGSQRQTISFNDRSGLWKCHRCNQGGSVIDLVICAHDSNFITALKYLAEMARVPLGESLTSEEKRRFAQQRAAAKRIECAALKLERLEGSLRLEYRDRIHRCERKQAQMRSRLAELNRGAAEHLRGETEGCWGWLGVLAELLQEALTSYSILAFGSALDRARFSLRPNLRLSMIAAVQRAGGFLGDEKKWVEVLQ